MQTLEELVFNGVNCITSNHAVDD